MSQHKSKTILLLTPLFLQNTKQNRKIFLFLPFLLLPLTNLSAQTNKVNQPIKNFDFLWQTFNDRYANFDLKKVDWQAMYTQYRPSINETTTNQELFEISCAMLQELRDGHVGLEPKFEELDIECDPPYTFSLEDTFATDQAQIAFSQIMDKTLLAHGFSARNNRYVSEEANFQYRTSNTVGYLRIDEMPETRFGKVRLNKRLDESMKAFKNKDALIIDLRFNGGGWDKSAYAIANRLVQKKQVGHYRKQRKKGTDEFKKLETWRLKPKGKIQFTKQIIILTSDMTASAAEVFILAMAQFPNVTLIGDTTEGIFSDIHNFKMPNKWLVSLSTIQFFSTNMVNYEDIGFEPLIPSKNSKQDLVTGKDTVLERTMLFLDKGQ